MDMNAQTILQRHGELAALRQPEEATWRAIARVMRPDDAWIGQDTRPNQRDPYEDVFDSAPLYAVESFIGGMFDQATNPAVAWFDQKLEDDELMQWSVAKDYCWTLRETVNASLAPQVSSFYTAMQPVFGDSGAFGFGTLYSETDDATGAFIDYPVPLAESFIDIDAFGTVNTFHRKFMLRGRQFKRAFGDWPNCPDDRMLQIIHAVWPNPDFVPDPGALGARAMPWKSAYVSPDLRDFIRVRHYYENPYHSIQWARRGGRVWPRGQGHLARADAAMLQEMERANLTALQYAADPMLAATDEAVITASDIHPGRLIYGAMNDNGKPLLQPVYKGEQLNYPMQHAEAKRGSIKEAFYFQMFQLLNRPQMTATEFLGFENERLRLLAPNLVRVHAMLGSFLSRRLNMLERQGRLPLPPPELKGKALKTEFVSPLAKAMKASTGKAATQWFGVMLQAAQVDPSALDAVDLDGYAAVTHDAYGAPPGVLRGKEEIAALREARAQRQQQQMQLEQAGQAADIMANVSHAQQAATLARGRGQGSPR